MDYTELLVEARERSGIPGMIDRGPYYVRNAERMLEKALKVGAMEKCVTLITDDQGNADLPDDFLELRRDEDAKVNGATLETNVPLGTLDIRYYAKLPSVETYGTNWLLDAEPELYMQAVLYQVYASNGRPQEAAAALQIAQAMAEAVTNADIRARFLSRAVTRRAPY